MLTIKTTQKGLFEEAVVARFVEELALELPQTQPEFVEGLSHAEIAERCRAYLSTGRSRGLSHRADLHGFVVLSFVLGPDFHCLPEVAAFLRDDTVEDGRKMLVVTTAFLRARRRAEQRRRAAGTGS